MQVIGGHFYALFGGRSGLGRTVSRDSDHDLRNTGVLAPSKIDAWVVDQFGRRVKYSFCEKTRAKKQSDCERAMEKKADISWIKLKDKQIEKDLMEIKRMFDITREKVSLAPKSMEVTELRTVVSDWSKWFRRSMIGVIVFLVTTGGAAMWQYSALSSKVVITQGAMDTISTDVKEMHAGQIRFMDEIKEGQKEIQESQEHLERKFEIVLLKGASHRRKQESRHVKNKKQKIGRSQKRSRSSTVRRLSAARAAASR